MADNFAMMDAWTTGPIHQSPAVIGATALFLCYLIKILGRVFHNRAARAASIKNTLARLGIHDHQFVVADDVDGVLIPGKFIG